VTEANLPVPNRPPLGSDPTGIVESWLPEILAVTARAWEIDSPCLRLSLSGAGGGEWELQIVDASLRVERLVPSIGVRRDDPDVWIRMPAADFLAVLFPSEDLFAFLPDDASVADLLFADAQEMELAAKLDGRIKFELEGRRRRRWVVDAAFGASGVRAGRPRTTVSIDAGTCEKLAARALSPLQALLAGRLRVEGDRTLAMQVLMLAATRMGG
jgi:putative sterol carrier protein